MPYVVNFISASGIQRIFFNAVQTEFPTDLWAATWLRTDYTKPFPATLQVETNYGNVNILSHVKPLIPILDCIENGGYQFSTATQFLSGANCGTPNERLNAIITKLLELPEGKRAFVMTRYNQGTIYNEVGDRFPTGGQSPWAEAVGITLDNDVTTIFTRFGASGATPDYISLDLEQNYFAFRYGHLINHNGYTYLGISAMYGITSSALYNQPWYGLPSFSDLFTNTITGKTFGFNNIFTGTYHPQLTRDYLFWDRAVSGLLDTLQNKFLVEPIKEIFPNTKISNYDSFIIADGGTLGNYYNYNGHPELSSSTVGDGISPVLYAGWNAPDVYGVYPDDPTRIVRTNYATTIPFPSNAWNHFLLLMQNGRAAKRDNPDSVMRPWIGSPYFSEPQAGYNAIWTQSTENLGLYYETIRHLALLDTEMFFYFNGGDPIAEDTREKMETALPRLNSVLIEINTIKGGYQPNKCVTSGRISFLSNYVITGAQTTRGTYLWRVTPKPGVVLESTTTRYVYEKDSDGGFWIETETSTPPGLDLTLGTQYAIQRRNDITRRYYFYDFIATNTNQASYVWDGWNYDSKATFMGKPDGTGSLPRTTRAYPFEYNPVNPSTSSPWHNMLYEKFFESYHAGMRAISIHFPWGSAFSNKTWLMQPLDQLYGCRGFTFIYPRAGLCGYNNGYFSTTEPEWAQSRIKGFTGAVKQLLQGQLQPAGRTGITQSCDVFLYIPGTNGWSSYRDFIHHWWLRSADTNEERDTALTNRIDEMADFIISMKPVTATGGLLSVGIDVGSYAPSPDSVHLFRGITYVYGTFYNIDGTTRGYSYGGYYSDVCELSLWNFKNKLEDNGIHVLTEARGVTQFNANNIVFPTTVTGPTAASGVKDVVGDENFFWYSDPQLASSKGDDYFAARSYIQNKDLGNTHRLSGSYLTIGTRLPWNFSTVISYEGATLELYEANYGDPNGSHLGAAMVYSPHYVASHLYGCADIYQQYLYENATSGNAVWGERRKLKGFSTYAFDPYVTFAGWPLLFQGKSAGDNGTTLSFDYRWWYPKTITSVNVLPLFDGKGFTTSVETKTPQGYPTTDYNGGFWTDNIIGSDTKGWFIANVKGNTFGDVLDVFRKIATQASPTGAPDPPEWLGSGPEPSPYPIWGTNDTYWTGLIDPILDPNR